MDYLLLDHSLRQKSIKFIRYDNANITTTYKSTRKVMAWD